MAVVVQGMYPEGMGDHAQTYVRPHFASFRGAWSFQPPAGNEQIFIC
jgi:hypothetical protein